MSSSVIVEWKSLNLRIQKSEFDYLKCKRHVEDKKILDNVSGYIESGHLVAILGASGAGKTTLLASISQRMRGPLTGEISINGQPINRKTMTKLSCFVPQFDITLDTLTPNEHLYFMGELKLDRRWPRSRKNERIEMLLQKVGLKDVANTRICRLSGGERKRLNLAADLLTNPPIIFCDEPTTGLDSFNARTVIKALKYLTQSDTNGDESDIDSENKSLFQRKELEIATTALVNKSTPKAVMCSIHQPTSEIFQCFSHLILMYAGRCVFQGTVDEAFTYFSSLGFECPINYNPADFYINVLSRKEHDIETKTFLRRPIEILRCSYEIKSKSVQYADTFTLEEIQSHNTIWLRQVWLLMRRSFIQTRRNKWKLFIALFSFLIPFAAMGLLFHNTNGRTQESIQDMQGVFFIMTCEILFTTCYRSLAFYMSETPILRRETNERIYTFSAFYIADCLCDIPFLCFRPFAGLCVTYFWAGFNRGFLLFVQMWVTLAMMAFTANAYGLILAGIFRSVALEVPTVFNLIFTCFAGIYINIGNFPILKYTSMFFFSNEALSILFWHDVREIECSPKFSGLCLKNGTQVLEKLSYNTNESYVLWDLFGMLIIGLIMHAFAFIGNRRIVRSGGYY